MISKLIGIILVSGLMIIGCAKTEPAVADTLPDQCDKLEKEQWNFGYSPEVQQYMLHMNDNAILGNNVFGGAGALAGMLIDSQIADDTIHEQYKREKYAYYAKTGFIYKKAKKLNCEFVKTEEVKETEAFMKGL